MPVLRLHNTHGLGAVLKDKRISSALAQSLPGEKFTEFLESHIEATATKAFQQLHEAIFNSALVFGHAILDDTLNECLRLGFELRPAFYYERVSQKTVSLGSLDKTDLAAIKQQTVEAWLQGQDRESVPSKFQLLCALTRPKSSAKIIDGFAFDLDRIKEIDNVRHSVVHSGRSRSVAYEDLDYLRLATMFAAGLLTELGAEVDPFELFSAMDIQLPFPNPKKQ